jgi:hypothetical protein
MFLLFLCGKYAGLFRPYGTMMIFVLCFTDMSSLRDFQPLITCHSSLTTSQTENSLYIRRHAYTISFCHLRDSNLTPMDELYYVYLCSYCSYVVKHAEMLRPTGLPDTYH